MKSIFFTVPLMMVMMTTAFAGGYQVNLQGARQLGMGHCGIGLLRGSSTVFFNPGGVSLLDNNSVSFGGSLVFANTLYQAPSPGIYQTRTLADMGTPFYFYGNFKPNPDSKLAFGLSINTPFGSTIEYEDDWLGKAVLQKMSLRAFFFQPTISYKVSDKLGLGIGFVYGTGSFSLQKAVPVQNQNGEYGKGVLSGKASGMGFNVGAYYQPLEELSIGITYRSKVAVSTNAGSAEFSVADALVNYFPSTSFTTTLNMPWAANLGIGYKVDDKLQFALDISNVGWSVYDTLAFDFVENTDKLEDIASPRMYRNTFIYRFGGEYKLSDRIDVRGGAYYDMTPVKDGYITPETPGSNKVGGTLGLSAHLGKLTVDLAYLFVNGEQRTATNYETQFGGTWKSNANIISFGFEYNF